MKFEVGDYVFFKLGYSSDGEEKLGQVTKVTPTGRAYVKFENYGNDDILFNPDGYLRGMQRSYNRWHIKKASQKDIDRIRKKDIVNRVKTFLNGTNVDVEKVDINELKLMSQVIDSWQKQAS